MSEYDDIIDLPRHVSKVHKQMSLYDRAAQFSPFAALVGYDDVIEANNDISDEKRILSEEEVMALNNTLNSLQRNQDVLVVHYENGHYINTLGSFKGLITDKGYIVIDKKKIFISDILELKAIGEDA